MKRWGWWLGLGLPVAVLLGAGAALVVSPEPAYRWDQWVALGRYGREDATIRRVAQQSGIDADLLKALAWRQSAFDPRKTGPGGMRGLLQVTEATAREWAAAERVEAFMVTDLFDVETNLRVGAWALRRGLEWGKAWDEPECYALVELAVGPARAREWAGETRVAADFLAAVDAPTREWVRAVLARRNFYRRYGW